ncbi:vacuolar protein sorting-associated protein 13D [Ditylenchus destructor]|uniref:Vacuolar protein sorting-associated protein 13D n=1 Tax=Ditylenchus destructor TaxID=166010 RepID=A0AAD4NI29_9BILA|nr:vacuolar protein sorting-associated protein 13D [Ditylenchus destructor]
MLEGLVAWVLNNYVGEYFENLNTDQLSIALLQGQVELENVPLKKTALRKFDIPVQVKSGVIGKLTLSIPMHMRSEPWVLKMSDLLVLLGPSTSKYDVEFVEQYEQSRKDQALCALEQHHKKQLLITLGQEVKDDDAEQNQWWGASLVSAITNNMQVILNNIHIRYEDDTIPGHTFNFGIRIENLSIQTTNSQWRPGFIQSTVIGPDGKPSNVFKKLDIKRLSVYWNCSAGEQVISDDILNPTNTHVSEFKKRMSPENNRNNTFILQQPFSMEVRMEKNSSKYPLKTVPPTPRFKFDLRPERIEVELSKRQIAQMRLLTREWARFDRARQHRKWRPLVGVKESPKSWWKFAIERTTDEWRRCCSSLSTKDTLRRVKHLNAYCRAYRRKLAGFIKDAKVDSPTCKDVPAISHEDIVFMKQIEHDSLFTYDELHLFRETIFRNYINQLNKNISTDDGEPEVFELISPDSPDSQPKTKVAKTGDNIPENGSSQSAQQINVSAQTPGKKEPNINNLSSTPPSGGWYGWLAGWFSKESSSEETHMEDSDANDGFLMDMWQATGGKHPLPPDLRNIEKRMEEEIIDVLNESWDDSTVLRRDNLLAELVLRLDRLIVRFLDEGPTTLAGCPSRVLALDMRRVASRVQLSPREHRTEICLSVGEMSVQRLQFPFDTSLGAAAAKHAQLSTIHDNRSEADGELVFLDPYSLTLQNTTGRTSPTSQMIADDDEEDESLLYGFGATDLILNNTQLMLTIGRANDMIMFGDSSRPSIGDKKNRRKSLTSKMRNSSINDSNIPMLK